MADAARDDAELSARWSDWGLRFVRHAAAALRLRGGHLWISAAADNLVRSTRFDSSASSSSVDAAAHAQGLPWIVESQGLPNLIHELGHAVQHGALAEDHGIDYQQIPFDLRTPLGLNTWLEELACCCASCDYLEHWLETTRASGAPHRRPAEQSRAWFQEQVEIQPVFYGYEEDRERFLLAVDELLVEHGPQALLVLAQVHEGIRSWLMPTGSNPEAERIAELVPPANHGLTPLARWACYRATGQTAEACCGESV